MQRPPLSTLRDPVQLLALGFGSGLSPRAPGTAGTLLALALDLLLRMLAFETRVAIVALCLLTGSWICDRSARGLGVHDHPAIVWDEIAAFLAVLLIVPAHWAWLALAFVLFRLFDIWKPWPIRELDHSISGGLGIMLDDILAGVYTAAILAVLMRLSA